MESKFEQLMQKYGIISEKNETSLQTSNGLPQPGTEISIIDSAASHPFVKGKGQEFQDRIKKYISENKKKTRKYRLLITGVNTIRSGSEYAADQGGPLGYLVNIVENHGTHNTGHFTIPLELIKIINVDWNANSGEIPDEWRYDTEKYGKFAQAIRGYFTTGSQPKGVVGTTSPAGTSE